MGNRRAPAFGLPADLLRGGAGRQPGAGGARLAGIRSRASDGRRFASRAERDRYEELLILQRAGEIAELECQPIFHFPIGDRLLTWQGRRIRYTADFRYRDLRSDAVVIEDVKGNHRTRDVHLRLALMEAVHGIAVRLTKPRRR
jgi:hypothetical protein